MATEQPSPSVKRKSTRKTENLVLPQLPQIRSKPLWQQTCPSFRLSKVQKDDESDEFTVKNECSSEYLEVRSKRRKIRDSTGNKGGAGPSTSTPHSTSHLKKQERFRSALVDFILNQDLPEEQLLSPDGTRPSEADSSTPIEKDILVAKDRFSGVLNEMQFQSLIINFDKMIDTMRDD